MTAPSTPQIPDELRPYLDTITDRLLSGHAAVMVGSGFSKNATSPGSHPGFPDWSLLGDRLYERLHGNPPGPNDEVGGAGAPITGHGPRYDFPTRRHPGRAWSAASRSGHVPAQNCPHDRSPAFVNLLHRCPQSQRTNVM